MKHFQKIQWIALALIVILGVVGCEMLAPDSNVGPTAPVEVLSNPAHLANFWVGRGQNKLGVYKGEELLQIQAPEGEYLLMYTTNLGTFYVVFKAGPEGAFLAIGLQPGDEVQQVILQKGTIPDDAPPLPESREGVYIYFWPGNPTVTSWEVIFTADPSVALIFLIIDGKINTDSGVIEILPVTQEPEIPVQINITGPGTVIPPGPIILRPKNSSLSLKFRADSGNFNDIVDVQLNGISVIAQVQDLGNGDGHLVIHNITEAIMVEVTFQ